MSNGNPFAVLEGGEDPNLVPVGPFEPVAGSQHIEGTTNGSLIPNTTYGVDALPALQRNRTAAVMTGGGGVVPIGAGIGRRRKKN